jgi:hypothetical protein
LGGAIWPKMTEPIQALIRLLCPKRKLVHCAKHGHLPMSLVLLQQLLSLLTCITSLSSLYYKLSLMQYLRNLFAVAPMIAFNKL